MLLARGVSGGERILSARSAELMTSDHLGPALSQGPNFAPGPGYGFGLTVAVRTQPTMLGPKKPPRLPTELMKAMPEAAAVPVSKSGGIAQNGPFEP